VCHCRDNIPSQWIRYLINYTSDYNIAVSAHIKKQLLSKNKVSVVYNGINAAYFFQIKSTGWLHKSLNLHLSTKIIGNIGQIVSWKNQIDYIRVAKELIKNDTKLHFLIIGNVVDENYYNQIKQLITNFNLNSYFTFTGYVNNIKRYFPELDIIIHTAINEPFGRVLIEAAAASKSVISYASGGPSEIIKNEETGFLVEDGNIEKMTELTHKLLNDQNFRESIGKTAQKYVAKHFNSEKYAVNIYKILIHDKCII
jgi:glycosyltransferase involved in cell wall biosynthesis